MGLAIPFTGDHGNQGTFQGRFQALIEQGSLQIKLILKNRGSGILKEMTVHFI
jgi:hypothetical protein